MGVDKTAASKCYKKNRVTLLDTAILGASSIPLFNLQTGIKSHDFLHIAKTEVELDDCTCQTNNDNSTHTFVDREISVSCIKVTDIVCASEFDEMYLEAEVQVEAGHETLGEAGYIIADGFAKAVAMRNEVLIYQGDKQSPNGNLNKADGFITIMKKDSGVKKVTIPADTTPEAMLAQLVRELPESAYERGEDTAEGALPVILMSTTLFRAITLDRAENDNAKCCVTYKIEDFRGLKSFLYPQTDVRIIGVKGMKGTNLVLGGSLHDFYVGTDLQNGWEEIRGWFDETEDAWFQRVKYKIGTQIAFPEDMYIASYTPSTATPTQGGETNNEAETQAVKAAAPVLTEEQRIANAEAAYIAARDAKANEASDASTGVKSSNTRALNSAIAALAEFGLTPEDVDAKYNTNPSAGGSVGSESEDANTL